MSEYFQSFEILRPLQDHPWLAVAIFAALATLAGLLLHRIGFALLRRATGHIAWAAPLIKATCAPARAVVPLLLLQGVWQGAPDTLRYIGNARHVNGLLLIAALTWLAAGVVRGIGLAVAARNPYDVADNLHARRLQTQVGVLSRSAIVLIVLAGAAMALMTFPGARQLGASLLASAGVISLVAGLAARPVFSNLIAGLQLALSQPLRLDDVLIVKGEYGRVEEITGTYVVLKLWDQRRMVVPLQWFIENPFENWTRTTAQKLQTVFLYLDYATPLAPLRAELERLVNAAPEWDRRVAALQVTDTTEKAMKVRVLVSAGESGPCFDLGCKVREGLLAFIAREHPHALPTLRLSREEAKPAPPEVRPQAAEPGPGARAASSFELQ